MNPRPVGFVITVCFVVRMVEETMRNIDLISASAGSGKTYSLTEKVLAAVRSGTAPERIMAVTFTNKAAAELKERIREKLTAQGDATLRQQAGALADGYIGTVNAICARLLKEFAFDAGDSPALDVLPEQESSRLFRLSVARVIEKCHAQISDAARRLARDGSGSGYAKKPDWRDDVRKIVDLARSNGLDADAILAMAADSITSLKRHLGQRQKSLTNDRLLAQIQDAVQAIAALDDSTATTKGALAQLRASARELQRGSISWEGWSKLAAIGAGKRSGADACLDSVREYAARVQHHPALHDDVEALIHGVFSCASEALGAFASYKQRNGLIDFADQESKVLRLLESAHVRECLAERIDLVLVDEFQDTSPIQLALFGTLASMIQRNVWVGDQKQAIYGFRGTDPQLMDEVIGQLDAAHIDVLKYSYRSRPPLVAYANALFTQAFDGIIPEDRVQLEPHRGDNPEQGEALGVWLLSGSKQDVRTAALARGIADLLRHAERYLVQDGDDLRPLRAGDIAVLSYANHSCGAIAESLAAYGIRASVGRGLLLAQPESVIAMASLRLLADSSDRLALAELVHSLPEHPSAGVWLEELVDAPDQVEAKWKQDDRMQRLLSLQVCDQSPLELFAQVRDTMLLEAYALRRSRPQQVLANLDALAALIGEYQDSAKARHEAATLPGLLYWLGQQEDPSMPEGRDADTVQVLTYHRSKGLEWPLVIVHDLDKKPRFSPFGVAVNPATTFDPAQPLAGRTIRFWPEPFKGANLPFGESIAQSSEQEAAKVQNMQERQRVMYVGITRARDYLIHAAPFYTRKKKKGESVVHADWLASLIPQGEGICLPEDADHDANRIGVGALKFACERIVLKSEDHPEPLTTGVSEWFMPESVEPAHHAAYGVSPSSWALPEVEQRLVQTAVAYEIGEAIAIPSGVEMKLLGDLFHHFIAADDVTKGRDARQGMAARILKRWLPQSAVEIDALLMVSDNFHQWVKREYAGAQLLKEWPIRLRLGNQAAHGWIDALIAMDQGLVLVDHKTIGADLEQCLLQTKSYAGQLDLYSRAVESATGSVVLKRLIHLPLQGRIVSVEANV
ncbi:MAG: UvrD-helicase domain-containing protein [Mariprofundales bacterium]